VFHLVHPYTFKGVTVNTALVETLKMRFGFFTTENIDYDLWGGNTV
jgi:hypothetical protein